MFRDLKEYQEITKIYQDSVHIPEEERIITQIIREENFTQEELDYVIENFDEIYDNEVLTEEFFDEMEGEYLEEMAGGLAKKVVKTAIKKVAPKVTKGVKKVTEKGVKQLDVFKDTAKNVKPTIKKSVEKIGNTSKKMLPTEVQPKKGFLQRGKDLVKSAVTKLKSGVKKVVSNPTVQKVVKGATRIVPGLALATGVVAGGKKLLDKRNKQKKDAAIEKQVDKYVADRKNPDGINKVDPKQFDSRGQKPVETKTETKPKKMHPIEKKNRARFGDAHVDKLKSKQVDFKAMRKGKMSKDDFIKKYPNSITAQKSKGLRDHAEWDAYDMVLEYLFSTEQVNTIEEANYVMMEMEQETIGSIVNDVNEFLEEGIGSVRILPSLGKMALGAAAVKGVSSYLGRKAGEKSIKKTEPKKPSLIKKIKDATDAKNKAIEEM